MDKKDYKEFAGIIKKVFDIPNRLKLEGSDKLLGYDKAIDRIKNRLADYSKPD